MGSAKGGTSTGRRAEKRRKARTKRRLMVRFGTESPERTAFTKNLSETGLFVQTNSVHPPGTTLRVDIQFPERTLSLWATVVWAKKVPPQLAHILECGMGLHFVDPGAEYVRYFRAWKESLGLR